MKELNVQKYLRSGKSLDDLKNELGIIYSTYNDLVVLNYHQIDSPKSNPIVMECRSLILELNTWNIVSMAFYRFFNKGEMLSITENFNYHLSLAQEKVDGSLISVFHYKDKWYMSTRGSIEGKGIVGFLEITFKQLFEKIIGDLQIFYNSLDKDYIYIFELTSIENRVVKLYKERSLYLLGMRRKSDYHEISYNELKNKYDNELKNYSFIKIPEVYSFNKFEDLLMLQKDMNATDEGFVLVNYNEKINGNFSRIKVKNPAYVSIAHMKENGCASLRCILQLIILGEEQEFLSYFPEFESVFKPIKEAYDSYVDKINKDIEEVQKDLKNNISRKDYAIKVRKMTHVAMMFELFDGKSKVFNDYIDHFVALKGMKLFAKKILKILNIKDVEFNDV